MGRVTLVLSLILGLGGCAAIPPDLSADIHTTASVARANLTTYQSDGRTCIPRDEVLATATATAKATAALEKRDAQSEGIGPWLSGVWRGMKSAFMRDAK